MKIVKSDLRPTGGGLWCHFLTLENGKLIVISEDCLGFYESEDAFYDGVGKFLNLPHTKETKFILNHDIEFVGGGDLQILYLSHGVVLGIDQDSICIYSNYSEIADGNNHVCMEL